MTIFALLLALSASAFAADSDTVFKVGICNYVDDASLNQIVENIVNRLDAIGKEKSVTFDISYDNCNADANVMAQIIQNFIADDVDLMVGVATPVAMNMQAATEDNGPTWTSRRSPTRTITAPPWTKSCSPSTP